MILCIETATTVCSVAICNDADVIGLKETRDTRSHASMLTVFINDLLSENGIKPGELDAVVVSKGPGSYTGLRIGVSAAKGFAYGASLPLIGIDTPFAMFYGLTSGAGEENTFYCPMLDARRMEVYNALYDRNGNIIRPISAEIIDESSFRDIPESTKIVFFGDGAAKAKEVIKRANVAFPGFHVSASHLRIPANKALADKNFEDIAYFEPFYLKDFIATKSVKNILGI